ncbi:MAG: CRISPR-associated endonuclease Cas1 [Verrucomicrobiales bacterium]|nr:CRISPR-associated endonuclease Cas1 [Verrucomicrobiales bacterium]
MIAPANLPDYLPARMLNEFVYCPRLFYYEWVEGVFAHNRETVEGELRHQKLDQGKGELASAEELAAGGETIHSRSVQLASETHRLIAKLDLIDAEGDLVTPVDYKRGSPREDGKTGTLVAWDPDRVQLAVQAIVLHENGYRCEEGVIYYVMTKQRVRVPIDERLVAETLGYLAQARDVAERGEIPLPLVDSPKCPRCSLVGICLPDETLAAQERLRTRRDSRQRLLFDAEQPASPVDEAAKSDEVRRLVPARDDLRPLYLNTQGLFVGKSGNVLKIKEKDKVVQEVRIGEMCQLNLYGNIQLSTQAIQTLCENEVPIAYFSMGGWFYGVTQGLGVKNIFLRREQFRLADVPAFCLRLSRELVVGKIRNQRVMLQRNHVEPPPHALAIMKCLGEDAERADSQEQLLGIEGNAARIYFENFAGMIKRGGDDAAAAAAGEHRAPETEDEEGFSFDFTTRNRRPPRDPVNALLSLAYSMLAKDLTIVTQAVGFDPYLGFYHQPRFGRASLALDLMEPFRPLIADSAVLSAINTRMVGPGDFVRAGQSVALTAGGRKAFFRAYEQRMDTLVTHPLFGYRANYRRILEIQSRLLARVLTGELAAYPAFVTR